MAAINKVLGAVALTGISGALTRIPAKILRVGDTCLVAATSTFYVYKCFESAATISEGPFSTQNPPYILKPEDSDETNKNIRWHLISSQYLTEDVKLQIDKFLQTTKIKGDPFIVFETGEGITSAKVEYNGDFFVKQLKTNSTKLVENLNAEFIKGVHGDNVMTRDGKRTFFEPVAGQEPIEPDHLATKNYVDERVNILDPDQFVKRDGSVSFTNTVSGFDPYLDDHLATKRYIDDKVESTLEDIKNLQNYIIYKTGSRPIAVNTSKITISFGGVLKSYTIFTTMINLTDKNPYSVTALVTKQTNTEFTVEFGGTIDTAGYVLNWMIVGLPLELMFEDMDNE